MMCRDWQCEGYGGCSRLDQRNVRVSLLDPKGPRAKQRATGVSNNVYVMKRSLFALKCAQNMDVHAHLFEPLAPAQIGQINDE